MKGVRLVFERLIWEFGWVFDSVYECCDLKADRGELEPFLYSFGSAHPQ